MPYRLNAKIEATVQVPGGEYTIRTPLGGTGPGSALSTGSISIPAGTLSGASFGVPLGDVDSPSVVTLRNGNQDLNVRLNGAANPLRMGAAGVLLLSQEGSAELSSISVSTVTAQTAGGEVTFVIAGETEAVPATAMLVADTTFTLARAMVESYSTEQLGMPTMMGPAERYVSLRATQAGTAHGLCVLDDGTLIVATAESAGDPSNYYESWWVIPPNITNGAQSDQVIRVLSGDVFGLINGARGVAQFDDGTILLIGQSLVALCTLEQLIANDFLSDPVTTWNVGFTIAYDCLIVPGEGHKVWLNDVAGVRYFDFGSQPNGGTITASKRASGSNWSVFGGFIAWSAEFGIYKVREMSTFVDLAYFGPDVLAALTDTPSNPAPTRVTTSPNLPQDNYAAGISFFAIDVDVDGNAWVGGYRFDSNGYTNAIKFSAAQLAAGGAQTPVATIFRPSGPSFGMVRMAPGYGLVRR